MQGASRSSSKTFISKFDEYLATPTDSLLNTFSRANLTSTFLLPDSQVRLKIFLSKLQVLAQLNTVFSITYPPVLACCFRTRCPSASD